MRNFQPASRSPLGCRWAFADKQDSTSGHAPTPRRGGARITPETGLLDAAVSPRTMAAYAVGR